MLVSGLPLPLVKDNFWRMKIVMEPDYRSTSKVIFGGSYPSTYCCNNKIFDHFVNTVIEPKQ